MGKFSWIIWVGQMQSKRSLKMGSRMIRVSRRRYNNGIKKMK